MYRDEERRHIHYQNKFYKEISQSGNVYAHLLSQYDDIQQRTNCDANNNIITPEEKIILEITHLFHDIPEK